MSYMEICRDKFSNEMIYVLNNIQGPAPHLQSYIAQSLVKLWVSYFSDFICFLNRLFAT